MDKNELYLELVNHLKEKKLSPRELSQLVTSSLPRLYESVLGQDKRYVIKRSGNLEKYQCEKFTASLERASDETNQPLGSGELKILCTEVSKRADKLGSIFYTWQLRDIILETLYKNKYHDVYRRYKKGGNL